MTTEPSQTGLQVVQEAGCRPVLAGGAAAPWHVLWTRSHCERLVQEQVEAKGCPSFLPTIEAWSRRQSRRHRIRVPLFPGYLFLNHDLDQATYVDVLKVRGLVRILGERWDRPAEVSVEEVEAIRRVTDSTLPAYPYPFLREGRRVRIVRGPLKDLEGIFLRGKPAKGLLVLSVELLQRSVAVEVDATEVAPV